MSDQTPRFYIGQKLWFVPSSRHRTEYEVTVTKIGRKWITIGHDRFDADSMWLDGGRYSSPGRVWLTRTDWEARKARDALWNTFWQMMNRQYRAPDHLTTADIQALIDKVKGS